MIEKYEFRKINNEDVLILYLDYNFKFTNNLKNNYLLNKINGFITSNKIKWKGNKIVLIVENFILGSLVLNKRKNKDFDYISNVILNHYDDLNNEVGYSKIEFKKTNIELSKKDTSNKETDNIIMLYRKNGEIEHIKLEEYLIGVVASVMPIHFHKEALKAQSIIARTYVKKALKENKKIKDNTPTQNYRDLSQLKELWKSDFDNNYKKVKNAVRATLGLVITYNDECINALYHPISNGYTESSIDFFGVSFPYLLSVNSSMDLKNFYFIRQINLTFEDIKNMLGINLNNNSKIEIESRTESGRVSLIRINDQYYSGIQLCKLLRLSSTDFDINIDKNKVVITTRGLGHGLGMSQYGANCMGNNGKSFVEILKHYYPGTKIKTV